MKQWTVIQQGIIKAQQAAQAAGAQQAADLAAQNAAAAAAQAAALAAGQTPAQAAAAGQAAAAQVAAQQAAARLKQQEIVNANAPQLGVVNGNLVTPSGMTLYAMNAVPPAETAPTGIQCTGACMQVWTAADPSWIGSNPAIKCKLTSFLRPDGVNQLACGVMPLYTFNSDKKPGDVFGLGNPAFNQAVNSPCTAVSGGA
jgi:predicted lipoprotein with Yx(FWY)xxD motif